MRGVLTVVWCTVLLFWLAAIDVSVVASVESCCLLSESFASCVEMPRTSPASESLDSEISGLGDWAGTAPEPNVGLPTGRSDVPMDVDGRPGAIGDPAPVATGGDIVAASAVPLRTRDPTASPRRWRSRPEDAICALWIVSLRRGRHSTSI